MISQRIRTALATLAVGAIVAPTALAAGEPKNEAPFSRQVANAITSGVLSPCQAARTGLRACDASSPQLTPAAEPKNEPPFTRPVVASVIVADQSGFSWADAAIGLAAGIGLAAVAAGALTVVNARRRVLRPTV